MRIYFGRQRCSINAASFVFSLCIGTLTFLPQATHAQRLQDHDHFSNVGQIYIADPSAVWFEKWVETNLREQEWLNRPDIKIKSGLKMVRAVSASSSAIGLLTRGELRRIQAAGAPMISTTTTELSVCAALTVKQSSAEASFGDLALQRDRAIIHATSDTYAIAEALIAAHQFKDRISLQEVQKSAVLGELSSGQSALAILPVLSQTHLSLPEQRSEFRQIEVSKAAAAALQAQGLKVAEYRNSLLQRLPLIAGVRTVCDEIVMISAPEKIIEPEIFMSHNTTWKSPLAGSDFETRVLEALNALQLLWHKTTQIKG